MFTKRRRILFIIGDSLRKKAFAILDNGLVHLPRAQSLAQFRCGSYSPFVKNVMRGSI